jgi:hypothetical protein
VPYGTTVWRFRERLKELGLIKPLFSIGSAMTWRRPDWQRAIAPAVNTLITPPPACDRRGGKQQLLLGAIKRAQRRRAREAPAIEVKAAPDKNAQLRLRPAWRPRRLPLRRYIFRNEKGAIGTRTTVKTLWDVISTH